MATIEPIIKCYEDITDAEWIMFKWEDVTSYSDPRQQFLRMGVRPLDESIRLAGGTIEDVKPYRWALNLDSVGYKPKQSEVIPDYETVKRDPNSPWLLEDE